MSGSSARCSWWARRSIVTAIAGTTRDVIAEPAEWEGRPFRLVDTGGMFGASTDPLHELVLIQGRKALETADLIVFDLNTIRDKATFFEPHQYSEGVEYVFVNGVAVVDQSKITWALPGKVLVK